MLPIRLVQVHYHWRRGGVQRVMGDYAETFLQLCPGAASMLVCSPSGDDAPPAHTQRICNELLDYRDFDSAAELAAAAAAMYDFLLTVLHDASSFSRTIVLGHNINLAKNLALSAAIARLAEEYRADERLVFINVAHDFAEEQRPARMAQVDWAEAAGLPARSWIWPPLLQVTVNRRNERILRDAGFTARCLPNQLPSLPPADPAALPRLRAALDAVSAAQGLQLDVSLPLYLYPSRVIARKNVVEAVIAVCLVLKGTLLLGGPGTDPADCALYAELRDLARQFHLPLILDAGRITEGAGYGGEGLSPLYSLCSAAFSSSRAEGFGYGIYEPWLAGKVLLGRLPAGIEEDGIVDLSYLYRALPLPAEAGAPQSGDFALLPPAEQLAVLKQACSSPRYAGAVGRLWQPLLQKPSAEAAACNGLRVGEQLCGELPKERFQSTILGADRAGPGGDPFRIFRYFNSLP